MSKTVDKTHELFMAASLSDDELGYPDRVAFIPGDQEWADDALWRNLTEGRATVLVSDENELLLIPQPRGLIDRLRGRVGVNVTHARILCFLGTAPFLGIAGAVITL